MDKLNCFSLTTNDHVAHLVLNKPESLNTMHPTFWRELDMVLRQLNEAGEARALVISSTGKHFSAGMSLDTFSSAIAMDADSPEGRAAIYDSLTDMQSTFTLLESMRIPVIAAIHGGCIGGAVDMVTACCIRRVFLYSRDQHWHGGRCGYAAAPTQIVAHGLGQRIGLYRPTLEC